MDTWFICGIVFFITLPLYGIAMRLSGIEDELKQINDKYRP